MTMQEPIIKVTDLKNYLGDHWVHDGVNFTVDRGDIVAIVGGSGSGKTTILRSLLTLLQPTSGSINVFGTELTTCNEKQANAIRRRFGMLFQHSALFSSLTLIENVAFPLNEFTELIKPLKHDLALLKIVLAGLPVDAAVKYPAQLSGGMQKRAALARAIALDPELLLLDEPTAGLDPNSANDFDELLLHLRANLGLTVVMVTHDLDSIWRVTDKVIFLGEGKVLAQKPIRQMIKDPHPLIQAFFNGPRGKRYDQQS